MRTRFVWPSGDEADKAQVPSFLFYQGIIRATPEAWGAAFEGDKTALLNEYYKNYVTEAYLVAAKVADKLRYLASAETLLLGAIRVLLFGFVCMSLTFAFVRPTPASANPHAAWQAHPVSLAASSLAPGFNME
jgi:hypothetical protein